LSPTLEYPSTEAEPLWASTIGIDYSGAQTPADSLSGLRVYLAEGETPVEIPPPLSLKKY
jgi:hypothetical protein